MAEPLEPPLRFAAVQSLRVFELDDESVVFDPLSWDTHLLNASAMAVLELLSESPRSEDDVAAFLKAALQPEEQFKATDHASRLIRELQSLGLVQAADATACAHR